jgi:prepilin-type N-terminal cleavage/methylation domain-containing protein
MRTHLHERLRAENGFTLVELTVVMVILTVVLLGLTTSFVSGMSSEVSVAQRQKAQQNARTALQQLRQDIHCASAVGGVNPNDPDTPGSGFTLTLTEQNNLCASVVSSSDASDSSQVAVQWCTLPDAANPGLFNLYRKAGTCAANGASLFVGSVTAPAAGWPTNSGTSATSWDGNLWPDARTCVPGRTPTLAVDLAVNPDPVNHAAQTYELKDEIALRNAPLCS